MYKRGMANLSEALRQVMRHWVTGVSIVTSRHLDVIHGMTVNAFTSLSLDPPVVSVTLANDTRTHHLVQQSGVVGITILAHSQAHLSDRFAGRLGEETDRFSGVETFMLRTGAPLIAGGIAFLDGQVLSAHPLPKSTIFLVNVLAAQAAPDLDPLIYFNRAYHRLSDDH
jgi:flavin reductase (DIM6/NTAB) family NADH-FMN oxidoreductase RutF